MGLVVGGVEIDRDPPRAPAEASLMPLDHAQVRTPIEGLDPDLVFRRSSVARRAGRPPPGRARAAACEWDRRRAGRHRIGMATRDSAGPAVPQRVPDLAGLPGVDQTLGEPLDHPVLPLRRLEQDGAAIGTRMVDRTWRRGACRRDPGRGRLWYRVVFHASASVVGKGSVSTAFVPHGGVCVSPHLNRFMNYPG